MNKNNSKKKKQSSKSMSKKQKKIHLRRIGINPSNISSIKSIGTKSLVNILFIKK